MKSIYILLLLLTTTLFAGYGYNTASVDIYDIDTGFYYKSISKKQKKSGFIISKASDYQISNINIYNPKTNKSRMIFKTHNQNIIDFLFEMEYYKKVSLLIKHMSISKTIIILKKEHQKINY
jgi:ribosomal protein L24